MILKEFSLERKVAIIAGSRRRWVATLASYLAEAGADVALASDNKSEMEEAVRQVRKLGRQGMALPTDVTNYQQLEKTVATVISKLGKIDILVTINDLKFAKPLLGVTKGEWQRVIDNNLTSVFLCTKVVGKHMAERKEGKIVTIMSGLAERGLPNTAVYAACQGAMVQFTKSLALEWVGMNIRVNGIMVGWMFDDAGGTDEAMQDTLVRYIPLRRLGQPDDLGAALVYLASDASSYVIGATFGVDGGMLAHG